MNPVPQTKVPFATEKTGEGSSQNQAGDSAQSADSSDTTANGGDSTDKDKDKTADKDKDKSKDKDKEKTASKDKDGKDKNSKDKDKDKDNKDKTANKDKNGDKDKDKDKTADKDKDKKESADKDKTAASDKDKEKDRDTAAADKDKTADSDSVKDKQTEKEKEEAAKLAKQPYNPLRDAVFLLNTKQYAAAFQLIGGVISKQPRNAEAHYVAAVILVGMRDYALAANEYNLVLQLVPGSELSRLAIAGLKKINEPVRMPKIKLPPLRQPVKGSQ